MSRKTSTEMRSKVLPEATVRVPHERAQPTEYEGVVGDDVGFVEEDVLVEEFLVRLLC